MSGRDKGKRPRIGSSGARGTFEHASVQRHYKAQLEGKGITTETNIAKKDDGVEGIMEAWKPILDQDWSYFTREPALHTSRFMIWEFYAHAWYREKQEPGCRKSWVRGVEIPFDAITIAQVLDLPQYEEPTDFVIYYRRDTLDPRTFEEIKNMLFLGGKDWNYGQNGSPKHVYAKHLRPAARFWAHFVMHNIYPQSHETEVKPAILRIVYGILTRMKVDAAFLMSDYIFHLAREKSPGYLGLPWVITQLCNAHEVPVGEDLLDLKRTKPMGRQKYFQFMSIARRETGVDRIVDVPYGGPPPPADPAHPALPALPAPAAPEQPQAPLPPRAPQQDAPDDEMLRMMRKMLRNQKRQKEYYRGVMQRTQLYDEQMRDMCNHMGVPFRVPPLTPAELSMFDSSSSDDAQGANDNMEDDDA